MTPQPINCGSSDANPASAIQQPSSGATTGQPRSAGVVGSGNYEVQMGDCIESIAMDRGFFWKTIWDHPNNQQLRSVRKDRNVLLAGDKVFVPELRSKKEAGATEKRHRFKRKGVPSKIRLVFQDRDKPRANLRYVLEIDGQLHTGKTDARGAIEHPIPPNARRGRLILGNSGKEVYELNLGNMDPASEITGVQSRLRNLGYQIEQIDGKKGPDTEQAIRDFQAKQGLPVTGTMDDTTRQKLVQEHGS